MDVSYRGKETKLFEERISDITGLYAVATNTGTAALHIALMLANIKDDVLCPALTFVATANAIKYCNAVPFFVDIESYSLGVDAFKLDRFLTKSRRRFKFLLVVHLLGISCDMAALNVVARRHGLTIIEDCCQAFGSYFDGKHVGSFGQSGALSFNGNKIITTGGGGAFITKSKKLYKKALHISMTAKVQGKHYIHDQIGYNYRMPALNAQYGLEELEKKQGRLNQKLLLYNRECNGWRKIDYLGKKGHKLYTPLHKLKPYKSCGRMNLEMTEKMFKEVTIYE